MKNEGTLISNLPGIHVDNLRCAGQKLYENLSIANNLIAYLIVFGHICCLDNHKIQDFFVFFVLLLFSFIIHKTDTKWNQITLSLRFGQNYTKFRTNKEQIMDWKTKLMFFFVHPHLTLESWLKININKSHKFWRLISQVRKFDWVSKGMRSAISIIVYVGYFPLLNKSDLLLNERRWVNNGVYSLIILDIK